MRGEAEAPGVVQPGGGPPGARAAPLPALRGEGGRGRPRRGRARPGSGVARVPGPLRVGRPRPPEPSRVREAEGAVEAAHRRDARGRRPPVPPRHRGSRRPERVRAGLLLPDAVAPVRRAGGSRRGEAVVPPRPCPEVREWRAARPGRLPGGDEVGGAEHPEAERELAARFRARVEEAAQPPWLWLEEVRGPKPVRCQAS